MRQRRSRTSYGKAEAGKKVFRLISKAFLRALGKIPDVLLDNTDRNRTSPFAFTGNKFEFRLSFFDAGQGGMVRTAAGCRFFVRIK